MTFYKKNAVDWDLDKNPAGIFGGHWVKLEKNYYSGQFLGFLLRFESNWSNLTLSWGIPFNKWKTNYKGPDGINEAGSSAGNWFRICKKNHYLSHVCYFQYIKLRMQHESKKFPRKKTFNKLAAVESAFDGTTPASSIGELYSRVFYCFGQSKLRFRGKNGRKLIDLPFALKNADWEFDRTNRISRIW